MLSTRALPISAHDGPTRARHWPEPDRHATAEQRRQIDGFGAHARIVVAQRHGEARQHLRRHRARFQRELSGGRRVAAGDGPDFHDEPDLLAARHNARRKERAFGVDRRKLHAIVGICERPRNRHGGFGVVRVLENLNGAQPRGRVLMFQTRSHLLERVLLRAAAG